MFVGYRLSAEKSQAVLADPAAAGALIYGDFADGAAAPPEADLYLDKAWHGLHFLLTGTAWKISAGAGAAILGGTEIGEDNGYGPARLHSAAAVRSVAAALDRLDLGVLRTRYDPAAMTAADIYPRVWGEDDQFDDFLAPHWAGLREFYRTAADEGQAVLLALT
jgi:hypothetical protein